MFKTHRTYDLQTGVKNNTIAVINDAKKLSVIYHKTIVFEAKHNMRYGWDITLRNGGWDTVSTRAVINRALEQICYTSTYLTRKKGQTFLSQNTLLKPFISGMKIKTRRLMVQS